MSDYLTRDAEVTVAVGERRHLFRFWKRTEQRIVVWRGPIVSYERGVGVATITLSGDQEDVRMFEQAHSKKEA